MNLSRRRPVAVLLPGQGAQHRGMGVGLYHADRTFTAAVDEFFDHLGTEGGLLRDDWLAGSPRVPIDDASRAQPLLFALGYALGRALTAHGAQPVVLLGHSVGELAAAALAGVFDLADAAQIMTARTRALAEAPPGGMIAVGATPEELAPYVGGDVAVAAVNAPRNTVLAGPAPALARTVDALRGAGIAHRPVPALQPYHCPAVTPAAELFTAGFAGVRLKPPATPILSTRTAMPVSPREATDPSFWGRQLDHPVLFWPALDRLLRDGEFTVVEAGPGQTLSTLARRHPAVRRGLSEVVPSLPARAGDDRSTWRAALDRLTGPGPATGPPGTGVLPTRLEPTGGACRRPDQ
ncbi:acyltransferase domain-containing protein [Actinoplanes sp. NPDC004185]